MEHSKFLAKPENRWIHSVIEVVRTTSLYFQPQIRTKILNEGWASYWHEKLFLNDARINGHEVDFAVVNAKVTSMPRVGLNPYALGMRMFEFIESQADKGRISYDYQRLANRYSREKYDSEANEGKPTIFRIRETFCDAMFINTFIDQEFVDLNKLFVADKRLNKQRMTWEYFVKSRKAEHYKKMVSDSLYHPPSIKIDVDENNALVINHIFEEKPLYRDYIAGTLMGIEFLWGDRVTLFTHEPEAEKKSATASDTVSREKSSEIKWQRIKYTMKDRKITRIVMP